MIVTTATPGGLPPNFAGSDDAQLTSTVNVSSSSSSLSFVSPTPRKPNRR